MKNYSCISCGTLNLLKRNSTGKYCNNKCQKHFEYQQKLNKWLSGEEVGWTGKSVQLKEFIRKYLFETRGAKCEICSWDKCHPDDGKILVEIDHIDGDAQNCKLENLRILCPNCHSMTSTFRARNKKSKRKR